MASSYNASSNMTGSFLSHESPAQNFMFDLTTTNLSDLASDLNEFNDFYKKDNQFTQIERPQNPFYKNFQSYQNSEYTVQQRNSFSGMDRSYLLTTQESGDSESPLAKKTISKKLKNHTGSIPDFSQSRQKSTGSNI